MSYGDPVVLSCLSDLIPDLVGKLPGCPPVAVRKQLADTAEEFCRETGAMRCIAGPFDFKSGERAYPIELPVLASVSVVHRVFVGGAEQHPSSYRVVDHGCRAGIIFSCAPAKSRTCAWSADVSMIPHKGCEDYLSGFLSQWGHAVVAGALAELMEDSTKRWFNQSKAARYAQKYSLAKQDAAFSRLQAGSSDGRLSFQNNDSFAGTF